jgi:signal peptidase II
MGMPSRFRVAYGGLVAAMVVVVSLDQLSKWWAADNLDACGAARRSTFDLCLAFNQGMAFSAGWGRGPLIAALAVAIVAVLLWSARTAPPVGRLLMGVVAGGAVGNLLDRAFREPLIGITPGFMKGAVVDFLYTSFWPTFNVADSAVVVGGILLAIVLWRTPEFDEGHGSGEPDGTAEPTDPETSAS